MTECVQEWINNLQTLLERKELKVQTIHEIHSISTRRPLTTEKTGKQVK